MILSYDQRRDLNQEIVIARWQLWCEGIYGYEQDLRVKQIVNRIVRQIRRGREVPASNFAGGVLPERVYNIDPVPLSLSLGLNEDEAIVALRLIQADGNVSEASQGMNRRTFSRTMLSIASKLQT